MRCPASTQTLQQLAEEPDSHEIRSRLLDSRPTTKPVGLPDRELDDIAHHPISLRLTLQRGEKGGQGGEERESDGVGEEMCGGEEEVGLGDFEGFAEVFGAVVVDGEEEGDEVEGFLERGGGLDEEGGPEV